MCSECKSLISMSRVRSLFWEKVGVLKAAFSPLITVKSWSGTPLAVGRIQRDWMGRVTSYLPSKRSNLAKTKLRPTMQKAARYALRPVSIHTIIHRPL